MVVAVVKVVGVVVTKGDNIGRLLPWDDNNGGGWVVASDKVEWLLVFNNGIGGEGLVSMSSMPFIIALFLGDILVLLVGGGRSCWWLLLLYGWCATW